jgi:hypothetical protein
MGILLTEDCRTPFINVCRDSYKSMDRRWKGEKKQNLFNPDFEKTISKREATGIIDRQKKNGFLKYSLTSYMYINKSST